MNRKLQKNRLQIPVFLAEASSVSERAARAMSPNGRNSPLANAKLGNVITLHNRFLNFQEGAAVPAEDGEMAKAQRTHPRIFGVPANEDATDER